MAASGQSIRYLTTRDNVRLAWATSGSGPPMVKASNWITHLEYDLESPVWRHWIRFLSDHFSLVRYDERGGGLSQYHLDELSQDDWLPDLVAVVEAARPKKPFELLGISQGACAAILYAVEHPEDVSHLVIYGGYDKGYAKRGDPEDLRIRNAALELMELCWGKPDPAFRRVVTSRFLPQGTDEQMAWFDELLRKTTSPEMAVKLMKHRGDTDVSEMTPRVRVPTLVIHAREDDVVPFSSGVELAATIPDAEFVELDSRNHILMEHEPAWQRFQDAVLEFTGGRSKTGHPVFQTLSDREREILAQLVMGRTNIQIGQALFISEKTVRNHVSRIFEKLGVNSRAQAMVFARDNGFIE